MLLSVHAPHAPHYMVVQLMFVMSPLTRGSRRSAAEAPPSCSLSAIRPKVEPDPIARQLLVNEVLRIKTIPVGVSLPLCFFISRGDAAARAEHLVRLARPPRIMLTFTASKSQNEQLDAVPNGFLAPATRACRLILRTGDADIVCLAERAVSAGERMARLADDDALRLRPHWSARLGRRTDLALGARHAVFAQHLLAYDETAVYGTLRLQF